MAADLSVLHPEFAADVAALLKRCEALGYTMRASAGLRSPLEQAKLWRQSRAIEEIQAKIAEFDAAGAGYLADCLRRAGPQHGDHVTDALPGYSWHQWGEAVDSFWLLDGKAEWSTKRLVNGRNGYAVYAQEAEAMGLTAGGLWTKFKDWPHVQWRKDANPGKSMSAAQVSAAMAKRFPV